MKVKTTNVYITRDTISGIVDIWPETVGIRKFHGCIEWGAAWNTNWAIIRLYNNQKTCALWVTVFDCKEFFGFITRPGTAYYINSKGKHTKVDIAFSP